MNYIPAPTGYTIRVLGHGMVEVEQANGHRVTITRELAELWLSNYKIIEDEGWQRYYQNILDAMDLTDPHTISATTSPSLYIKHMMEGLVIIGDDNGEWEITRADAEHQVIRAQGIEDKVAENFYRACISAMDLMDQERERR